MKIELDWYARDDVNLIARQLLGMHLCTFIDGVFTSGIITETEAYSGFDDKACHAHLQKRTKRTSIMFEEGGHAYIYLCYGIHHLFNIVTNVKGSADAILVRAIQPLEGTDFMQRRRKLSKVNKRLTAGPGVMSQALGIRTKYYGEKLDGKVIWVEYGNEIKPTNIVSTTRIGVDYAEEDALKPWRYYIKESSWVSIY